MRSKIVRWKTIRNVKKLLIKEKKIKKKKLPFAPGEARTRDLRISLKKHPRAR